MKVFISHSSHDKWIAQKLSEELIALGATTFLDSKDIVTGESIDESIQAHLSDCDEILMLLSPAALASHWVLLEVGGAKALGKTLIPILLHVGPNELPQPLGKGLARDLNDVDKYLSELSLRMRGTGATTPRASAPISSAKVGRSSRQRRKFKAGDLVKIPEQPQPTFSTDKYQISWTEEMNVHAGKTATVVRADTDRTVTLDVESDSRNWWAMDWLEPAG